MKINPILNSYSNYEKIPSKIIDKKFSDIFHDLGIDQSSFEACFQEMDVTIHAGAMNISKENWNRNDFPVWELFRDHADIEKINKWKPNGLQPAITDVSLQKKLSTIDAGQMAIIMPDSVFEKIKNDEQYKEKVVRNIEKWKSGYDLRDNAIAASYGANVELYQMSKSYCISLDDNGNVKNNIVISDSMTVDRKKDENETISEEEDKEKKK